MPRSIIRNTVVTVVVTLLTCASPAFCEESKTGEGGASMRPPARMPFLVAGMMPHLTGTLMQHWDDPDLDEGTHGFNFMGQLYGCDAANGLWVVPGSHRGGKADSIPLRQPTEARRRRSAPP